MKRKLIFHNLTFTIISFIQIPLLPFFLLHFSLFTFYFSTSLFSLVPCTPSSNKPRPQQHTTIPLTTFSHKKSIDPFNKYRIRNFHPMTSNSFQFAFWILFNYVYSLNKPETINEIEKNLTSLGGNYVFCTRVSQTLISGPNSYPGSFLRSLQEPGYEVAPGPCRTGGSQALWTRLGSVHKVNFILHFFSPLQRLLCWRRAFNSGKEAQVHV